MAGWEMPMEVLMGNGNPSKGDTINSSQWQECGCGCGFSPEASLESRRQVFGQCHIVQGSFSETFESPEAFREDVRINR